MPVFLQITVETLTPAFAPAISVTTTSAASLAQGPVPTTVYV